MSEYIDEDADLQIGRNSIYHEDLEHPTEKQIDEKKRKEKWLGQERLHTLRSVCLFFLVLPFSVYYFFMQLKMFVVVGIFNYTGFNVRPYLYYDIETEREILATQEKYSKGAFSFGKVKYLAQRYMTYWIVIIMLIIALRFINTVSVFYFIDQWEFVKANKTIVYVVNVALSLIIGFANIIPAQPIRPDISTFISSFTGMDIVIRDSPHTRLKDLTEILDDIKHYEFIMFHTDVGNPIIVSTRIPEELNGLTGFNQLLSTNAFDNNQILRFIQIVEDVDSFYVLRNDIGMCHRIDYKSFLWTDVIADFQNFKPRVEISDLELNLYGGASLVLLVGLFSATEHLHVSVILMAWVIWPILFALVYRRKRNKMASINFFTLDGSERKYQPYNNINICTDDVIQQKIQAFQFFDTLYKLSLQGKYLMHIVLKCAENVKYDWLSTGIKVADFKRLARMAATLYQLDVCVVTPTARIVYAAPKHHKLKKDICVVFTISMKDKEQDLAFVQSAQMTKVHFDKAFKSMPFGHEDLEFENMFLK